MSLPTQPSQQQKTVDAPHVVDAAERERLRLLELEDAETQALIRRWIDVEKRLSAPVQNIVDEIIARRERGETFTKDDILKSQAVAVFTAIANDEFDGAITDLTPTIHHFEKQAIQDGDLAARVLIAALAIDLGRRARLGQEDFQEEALETFVFGLQDINATLRILKGERPSAIGMISDVIFSGAFSGFTPKAMFSAFMYEAVTQSLAYFSLVMRDLLATRHRNAMRWVYENTTGNSVFGITGSRGDKRWVTGYRRRSRRDFRVCMACLALDGALYKTGELMHLHPNERCFMVPILRDLPIPTWETGRDWLTRQARSRQIEFMGKGAFSLWQAGMIGFDDFIKFTGEQKWGPGVQVTPLYELEALSKQRFSG